MLAHAGGADESLSLVLLFAGIWVGWAGWSRLKDRGFPRLPLPAAYTLVAAGVILAVSAAIIPRRIFGPTGIRQASPAAVRPASTATIGISQPVADQVVTGDSLDVVLTLQGGTIVAAASTKLTPDTGHVHLSLDGTLVSMTYGLVQEISVQGLAPGTHTLLAEFVAADHGPFDPRVTASVSFVIPKASP
jgi:Family of unknown function (DUF6130)